MNSELLEEQGATPKTEAAGSDSLAAVFDAHIAKEFVDRDVDATMATMIAEPYVHCVPLMTGGSGGDGVRRFYSEHFVNQIPKDAEAIPISRTIGKDQVVDEFILRFTHDTQWDYLLPGIPPTGKRVEIPHVVVMKFENGKIRTSTCGGIRPRYLCKWDCSIRRNYQWQASSKREGCCARHDEGKISNRLLQLSRRREHLGLVDESKFRAGRVRRGEFNGCEQPCYRRRPWVASFSLGAKNVQH